MNTTLTPDDLLAFEADIAGEFARGAIKSPVHLGGGNESELITIFKNVRPDDWVLCGWRSHYHALLKGVPPDELKAAIMAGHSVSLCFPAYRMLSSGIVGGTAPIATGLAWAIHRANALDQDQSGGERWVWVFLGDMTAEAGVVFEAMKYCQGHQLPVRWVVENNGLSVCTDTRASWGGRPHSEQVDADIRYNYKLTRPHCGIGSWVKF